MAALRFSKNGRPIRTGYSLQTPYAAIGNHLAEEALQHLLAVLDGTPLPTWPHWAGAKQFIGQSNLTAHGEITSPYLKSLRRK